MEVKVEFSNVFRRNYRSRKRVVLNEGGARSSKSYSIAQLFIKKLFDEDKKNFLITRKTLPSLRITSYTRHSGSFVTRTITCYSQA